MQIATTLIPKLPLAAASSFVSSIPTWGWFDIAFTLMVLVGICGESSRLGRVLISERPNDLMPVEWKRKQLEKWSEIVLIIGIAGETICLAFSLWESAQLNKDAAHARQEAAKLELQIEQIKPENLPIRTIAAFARILVKGDKYMRQKRPTDNWHAGIAFLVGSNINQNVFGLSATESDIEILNILGDRTDREYRISFHQRSPSPGLPGDTGMGKPAGLFNDVGSLVISLPQIDSLDVPESEREHASIYSTNTEVLSGSVTVTLNSTLTWAFDIPPQKQRYGFISSQKITNAANRVEAKVLPFGVADWSYPSRLTNAFFNGK